MISEKLKQRVMSFEGFRSGVYKCTSGKLTVGYGHNLEDTVLPKFIADLMLDNDLKNAEAMLFATYPAYLELSSDRRDVLIDMCFNLGIGRLRGFVLMHDAIAKGNFALAAEELLDSRYAIQVGKRAIINADFMEKG